MKNMLPFSISSITAWVINAIFFLLIVLAYRKASEELEKRGEGRFIDYAPSLMTSLGLFGTFLGIFIGLMNFDSTKIDASIEQLLDGLKTAFLTSLMGMGFAIRFKMKQTETADGTLRPESSAPTDIGPRDIYAVLVQHQQELQLIAKGIGGNDERSLVGQLQMLRTDVVDFRSTQSKRQTAFEERLWTEFAGFAEMMSRSATQQVIEALKEVIVEFNEKLTEQFGENFKRLDASVQKLVEWQAAYMVQMEEMATLYAQGVESISSTKVAVDSIRVQTERIPIDMAALGEVLRVNQHQIQELARHLEVFTSMRDQAIIAVPQIQQKLEEVGLQLQSGAERVNMVLIEGSKQFEDSVKQTNQGMVATAREIAGQAESISTELNSAFELLAANTERIRSGITGTISQAMESVEQSASEVTAQTSAATTAMLEEMKRTLATSIEAGASSRSEFQKSLDSSNSALAQHAERSLSVVEKQVQDAVNRTNEAVNSQLRQLDEALSRQLNAALQELGGALGTIAKHIGESYQRGSSDRARIGN